MGKYGLSVFGVGVYGADDVGVAPADFDVSPFTVVPEGFGMAKLRWSTPTGDWSILRIVRSTRGLPADELDGTILFDRTGVFTPAATDTGLTPGHWYYYSLFLYDTDSSSWVRSGADSVLIPADYGYTQRLADLLPTVWKVPDLQGIGSTEIDLDSSLYRFLSVFGYALDIGRTEVDSLLQLTDPNLISEVMLPAALAEFGLDYEPMLGTMAMRKLLRNAVHLYQVKGTSDGIAEFCSAVTGWPVTISIGKNLALDDAMAGFNGGIGMWARDPASMTLAWRANDGTITAPVGDGMVAGTISGTTGIASLQMTATTDPIAARLASIPVTEGLQYTASFYLWAAAGVPTSAVPALSIVWLDASGAVLNTSATTLSAIGTTAAWHRLVQTGTAPSGAAFAFVSTSLSASLTSGMHVYYSGFQFEQASAATAWECARKVKISLAPDLINEILNPSGGAGVSDGWVGSASPVEPSSDGGPCLSINFGDSTVQYVDGTCGRVGVYPGEIWTFMVDILGPTAERLSIGMRELFGGVVLNDNASVLASSSLGPLITPTGSFVQYRWEYTVPLDGSVQEIQPLLFFSTVVGGDTIEWRHASLQRTTADGAVYFDGSTSSSTNDYVWEGDTNDSRSLRFRRRSIKVSRLTALLPDWMLTQSCYEFDYVGGEQHSPVYLAVRMVFATAEAVVPVTDSFTRADGDLTSPWVELI